MNKPMKHDHHFYDFEEGFSFACACDQPVNGWVGGKRYKFFPSGILRELKSKP